MKPAPDSSELTDEEARWLVTGKGDPRKMKRLIEGKKHEYDQRRQLRGVKAHHPRRTRRTPSSPTETLKATGAYCYPFLKLDDVPEGKALTVTIVSKPRIIRATYGDEQKMKYQCDLSYGVGELRTWNMNSTTYWKMRSRHGENYDGWVGKKMKLKKVTFNVQGTPRIGIVGEPLK
jgi:hypothetical protein